MTPVVPKSSTRSAADVGLFNIETMMRRLIDDADPSFAIAGKHGVPTAYYMQGRSYIAAQMSTQQ